MENAINICIGANYGDEGKGRTVDYFVKNSQNPIVVRFNGGAQAGHTVVVDGKRHVFSHFGAGTFRGAPTYFTKDFVIIPEIFRYEMKELTEILDSNVPKQYYHQHCVITSPWDVALNQLKELSRGNKNHGSVGLGFGETIERSEKFEFIKLNVQHAQYCMNNLSEERGKEYFIEMCWTFFNEYYLPKIEEYSKVMDDHPVTQFADAYSFQNTAEIFYQAVKNFISKVEIVSDENEISFLQNFDQIIFEGAQGLALDQNAKDFPHVTRSNTGCTNIINLVNELALGNKNYSVNIVYISRPYFTRHGAGPLNNEVEKPDILGFKVVDATNVPNTFQGTLRFAAFNLKEFHLRVFKDICHAVIGLKVFVNVTLAFSCVDQISSNDGMFTYFDITGKETKIKIKDFFKHVEKYVMFSPKVKIISFENEGN